MLRYLEVQNFVITVGGIIASGPLYVALPHWDININCFMSFVVRIAVLMSLIFLTIRPKT
jgi:hypothetical protein